MEKKLEEQVGRDCVSGRVERNKISRTGGGCPKFYHFWHVVSSMEF